MKKLITLLLSISLCLAASACSSEPTVTVSDPSNVTIHHTGDLDYYKTLVDGLENPEEELMDKVLQVTGQFTDTSLGIYYIGDLSGNMKCALSFSEKTDAVKSLKFGETITVTGNCISAAKDYIQLIDAKLVTE